jgi:hypothetical protein
MAEQPVRQRLRDHYRFLALGGLFIILLSAALESFGVPFHVWVWVMPATVGLFIVWLWDSSSRFNRYSWAYDRTPADAPWAAQPNGMALVKALQRVSLNDLRSLTLQTRLRSGLKLTNADMSELLRLLGNEGHLAPSAVDDLKIGDPAVADFLGSMTAIPATP